MIFISSSNRKIVSERGKKNLNLSDIIFDNSFIKKIKKGSNYHWNNNIKLKKDLNYIFKIYKKLLIVLTNNLNKIHKKIFLKILETLLWRWLSRFIIYHYDRWEIISSLKKRFNDKDVSFNFKISR